MKLTSLIALFLTILSINSQFRTLFGQRRERRRRGLDLGYEYMPQTNNVHHDYDFGYGNQENNNYMPRYEDFRYSGYQGYPHAPYSHNGVFKFGFNGNRYSSPFLY